MSEHQPKSAVPHPPRPAPPPFWRLARWAFLGLAALAFSLSAAILTWSAFMPHPEPSLQVGELKTLLPTGEAYGWKHEDLPLGNTEALQEASERILNLTDYVYRRYTRGPDSFEVYIGYWAPGTMPARDMNTHTPDTCWVAAGWEITEKRNDVSLPFRAVEKGNQNEDDSTSQISTKTYPDFADGITAPGRWRWFKKNGQSLNVIFWHVVDGEPYQYAHQSFRKRLDQLVLDPFRYKFDMRREQFLIRIASPHPLENLRNTELLNSVFQSTAAFSHHDP